ncbi:hypothetical protein Droror1_Dr00024201 [Drosera rotundifolia]
MVRTRTSRHGIEPEDDEGHKFSATADAGGSDGCFQRVVLSDGVVGIEAIVLNVIIHTKVNLEVVEGVLKNSTNGAEPIEVKEVKKEDEEFIKIEKDESSSDDSPSKQFASRQILEAGEKIRELEFELEKIANALKHAESENAELKHELYLTNQKFEERGKMHVELEHHHKKL